MEGFTADSFDVVAFSSYWPSGTSMKTFPPLSAMNLSNRYSRFSRSLFQWWSCLEFSYPRFDCAHVLEERTASVFRANGRVQMDAEMVHYVLPKRKNK